LVEGIGPGVAWLASLGVEARSAIDSPRQTGAEVDVEQLTERMTAAIRERGGELGTSQALERLDGSSAAVVLATGGFGGSGALREQHIGRWAGGALLRANPHSTGDGLRIALAAGGRTTRSMATVYGHTMPAPPADPPPSRWTAVTQYATQDGVLLDLDGLRFFDESRSMQDEVAASSIVRRREARAFFVIDRRLHDDEPIPGRSVAPMQPNFRNAVDAGAPHAVADSLEELADALGAWGVDRDAALATLREYDTAIAAGRGADLPVPRTGNPIRLEAPPFHALGVRAGITFTLGGIEVDDDFRVLDAEGAAIPGLFGAGADAGGTYDDGYMGGLVLGLVQGRIAGRNAARWAAGRDATAEAASAP
jgi:succinate dehydrogenase/fumarate reductase flavoprotein subunit